ncbi:MAG: metal ABC transporter ATP-binding protein [Clostridia bacterium]|nr:metal ABC transporter ATP-binding protein [Clostridia bacterium]
MIRAENLSFSYTGSRPFVLDGISFNINDGEYVSVVGENGCGKSTLMRLILKFLKPTQGSIVSKAKRIGYMPQKNDFSNAGFPITVYEMLSSYRRLLKIKSKDVIRENLALVGLTDFSAALMGTLSGGQSQKAFIARALMGSPELLVLDEPSTGVDVDSQKDIYGLIKKLNTENGITIVSVEHNLDAAVSNSTLIYHLSGGHGHFCTPQKYAAEYLNIRGKDKDNA